MSATNHVAWQKKTTQGDQATVLAADPLRQLQIAVDHAIDRAMIDGLPIEGVRSVLRWSLYATADAGERVRA